MPQPLTSGTNSNPERHRNLLDTAVWQNPERMGGVLCFAGTRVPVATLFEYLAAGDTIADFLEAFPGVRAEQTAAVLDLALERLLGDADIVLRS